MFREIAEIRIAPGRQAEFDEAIVRAVTTVITRAHGVLGWRVDKGIESPERYVLQIDWETVEDHTVGFRGSTLFAEWRSIIGPFFAEAPRVEHFVAVGASE